MKKPPTRQTVTAMDRQKEIYLGGMAGQKPLVPHHFKKLQEVAVGKMTAEAVAYIVQGAGAGDTIRENRSGFQKWRIVPRMLRDVSVRDTSIELFGQRLPSPFLTCPIGVSELVHPEGDLAIAKATASLGVPMIFSNQASYSMEQCAAVMGDSPRWFQLYWSKSNELVESLVTRAEACGCSAIVVTLDTTLLGWREHDLDVANLPFLKGQGIAQYTSDPVFLQLLNEPEEEDGVKPPRKLNLDSISNAFQLLTSYPDSFWENVRSKKPLKAVKKFINIYSRPSLTWDDLPFLRKVTKLPILLKGILHPEDAIMAAANGIDGIIVSNHGGRQVDGSIAAIDALPGVITAVDGQIPVLMDSGIRGGADMFKALALGAKAVCLGRPYIYGLAIAGSRGVQEVLKNTMADFELTMGLAGCKNVGEIKKESLVRIE